MRVGKGISWETLDLYGEFKEYIRKHEDTIVHICHRTRWGQRLAAVTVLGRLGTLSVSGTCALTTLGMRISSVVCVNCCGATPGRIDWSAGNHAHLRHERDSSLLLDL